MKCPKCGSEDIQKNYPKEDLVEYYLECGNCFEEIAPYQRRLDKVLSKFENKTSGIKVYVVNKYLEITYFNDKFHLSNPIGNVYVLLETVESLLKDLEGKQDV